MTPEQIKSLAALADMLEGAAQSVQEANTELESIELAIKGHRKSLDTLFDREREVRTSRDQLVEAMEKAQAGLEAFEAAMPEDVPGINEESGLAEIVGRMSEGGEYLSDDEDEGTPASLPTEPGVMMQEASENLAEAVETVSIDDLSPEEQAEGFAAAAAEMSAEVEAYMKKEGGASEAMLNELAAADKAELAAKEGFEAAMNDPIDDLDETLADELVELDDVSDFVSVEELAAMSDDLKVADVETAGEVIDATQDIISDRASVIAQDAAGQFANSGKLRD